MRNYGNTNGALTFYLRKDSVVSDSVYLGMNQSKLKLTNLLNNLEMSEWEKITVPLSCYVSSGLNLRSLKRSFSIETQGKVKISIAGIKLVSKSNYKTCP